MLPRFEIVARRRPVDLVAPGSSLASVLAPYVAVTGPAADDTALTLGSGRDLLLGRYDGRAAWLEVTSGGRTTRHRSLRFARTDRPATELGLTLTGTHLSLLTRDDGPWTVRARVDLREHIDTRDEAWLAALGSDAPRAGGFGQLGLRDLRQVTHADGTTYRDGGRVLLTATSAGPGFFDTAHTSVWALDPDTLDLAHRADLFFRRPDAPGAFGDHATHLVRDGDRWLVATSTWGDFDQRRPDARVRVTLAETTADLTTGRHLLDTRPLPLPTGELTSVGVWDPHLVRDGDRWLVGFVTASRFFRFHPALASGPALDALSLRAADPTRTATEGTTLIRLGDRWRVLASDGRDGRRGQRERYPVFDLDLREIDTLSAPYPTNIPWPTLVPHGDSWLWVAFNGRRYGGALPGYGTHGEVVLMRPSEGQSRRGSA